MSNYLSQLAIFRAYDIRGERQYFTPQFICALSHAFALTYAASLNISYSKHNLGLPIHNSNQDTLRLPSTPTQSIVIGHDVRHLSLEIAEYMAQTLVQYGVNVIWLGLVTTPIMAFWAEEYDGHGIIATASHSESHINGIKWLIDAQSPSSEDIQAIYNNLDTNLTTSVLFSNYKQSPLYQVLPHDLITHNYNKRIYQAIDKITHQLAEPTIKNKLTVVIDCLNGATAPFVKHLFEQFSTICDQVHCINSTTDPNFAKGNPDPTEAGRLTELQQAVIKYQADIGLSFDGDGDRLAVVDNNGQVIVSDHLLYILAHIAITDRCDDTHPMQPEHESIATDAPSVVFDVKCSHHLPTLITQLGAVPTMSKTGSSIMRKALQNGESNVVFAGELSGHFLFNDGFFILHDDAMYASLRLVNWLSRQHQSLSDIINALPTMISTPDVYLPLDYADTPTNDNSNSAIYSPILAQLSSLCGRLQRICVSPLRSDKAVFYNVNPNNQPDHTICDRIANLGGNTACHITQLSPELCLPNDCLPTDTKLTCIDGIRLDFDNGFGIVRPSNTSHSLTVRFAGNTLADLQDIQAYFVNIFKFIDGGLASQIASICPSS